MQPYPSVLHPDADFCQCFSRTQLQAEVTSILGKGRLKTRFMVFQTAFCCFRVCRAAFSDGLHPLAEQPAHTGLRAGAQGVGEADAVVREEVDDGGAEAERAHFLSFFEFDGVRAFGGVEPLQDGLRTRGVDDARPCGADTGGYGCADEDLHHAAEGGVEHADEAFVAGEEVGDVSGEEGVDRVELARDVDHAAQGGGAGHVDAVVVARGEVGGEEEAV